MTYAIVRKDQPDKAIRDIAGYAHIYSHKPTADIVCADLGDDYMVVPW